MFQQQIIVHLSDTIGIDLFVNEMSERLLIVLLWDVFHRSIHRRAPRAFPWGRNLPRRHFLSRFGFFVKLFSTTSFQPASWWESDGDWTARRDGCEAYIGCGCLKAPEPTSAHSQVASQRLCPDMKNEAISVIGKIFFATSAQLRPLSASYSMVSTKLFSMGDREEGVRVIK